MLGWPAFENRRRNPHTALLYGAMRDLGVTVEGTSLARLMSGRYDVWHLHWPERFLNNPRTLSAVLRTLWLLLRMDIARARGVRVVWTAHNLRAHERAHLRLEERFWPQFLKRIDAFISLSESGHEAALKKFPQLAHKRGYVIPRGHYRGSYPDTVTREDARAALGLDQAHEVLAFIGQIRTYKNLPRLIAAFRAMPGTGRRLVVAGHPDDPGLAAALETAAAEDARILYRAEFVPDDKMQVYLRAADVVVLPYTEILNSGAALLALSFDQPVLAPHMGSLIALQARVGQEWLRTYSGELGAAELDATLQWARQTKRGPHAPLHDLEWSAVARETAKAFTEICGAPA